MTIILEVYVNHDDSAMKEEDGSVMMQVEIDDDNIANLAAAVNKYQNIESRLNKRQIQFERPTTKLTEFLARELLKELNDKQVTNSNVESVMASWFRDYVYVKGG